MRPLTCLASCRSISACWTFFVPKRSMCCACLRTVSHLSINITCYLVRPCTEFVVFWTNIIHPHAIVERWLTDKTSVFCECLPTQPEGQFPEKCPYLKWRKKLPQYFWNIMESWKDEGNYWIYWFVLFFSTTANLLCPSVHCSKLCFTNHRKMCVISSHQIFSINIF